MQEGWVIEMYYLQQFYDDAVPDYQPTAHIQTTLHLCRELFDDELKAGIALLGCCDFLSYKDVQKLCAFVVFPLIQLLRVFFRSDRENARLAASDMIRTLSMLDTDDDVFPAYEIQAVQDAVGVSKENV